MWGYSSALTVSLAHVAFYSFRGTPKILLTVSRDLTSKLSPFARSRKDDGRVDQSATPLRMTIYVCGCYVTESPIAKLYLILRSR